MAIPLGGVLFIGIHIIAALCSIVLFLKWKTISILLKSTIIGLLAYILFFILIIYVGPLEIVFAWFFEFFELVTFKIFGLREPRVVTNFIILPILSAMVGLIIGVIVKLSKRKSSISETSV